MPVDVFSDAWAEQWKARLNQSQAYRKAGRTWIGSLVMSMEGEEDESRPALSQPAVFADLREGRCLAARAAGEEDRRQADFVIAASPDTWKGLFEGSLDPMFAVLQGRLNLRKGKPADLLPYAQAAKEMVAAAKDIETRFGG